MARCLDLLGVDAQAARKGLAVVGRQHQIIGDRVGQHQAGAFAVFGDIGHAQLGDRRGVAVVVVAACYTDPAAGDSPQPVDRLDQLGLAVALYAGDAQDLAGVHLERNAVDRQLAAIVRTCSS